MYLTQGLHRLVQQQPDGIATVCAGRVRTNAESVDRIARLAAALSDLGVRDGARAAILSLNSDRFSEFLAATLWAGGVVVPVNCRWSVPEIADSLREVDARVLVVDDAFAACADGLRELHPGLIHVVHSGDGPTPAGMLAFEELISGSPPMEDTRRGGNDLAGVFYTGGTTGRAKGVMLSHDNLLTSCITVLVAEHSPPDRVFLHAAPMFHLADFSAWVTGGVVGGTQVMIPAFDPVAVMAAVQEHEITDVLLVPTMIQLTVDSPRADQFDLTSIRRVLYGASPMSDALLGRAMKALPNARFLQAYGMTELAPIATLLTSDDHEDPERRRSVGRAAPCAEVRIVGPDDDELPRRGVGEVVVRGGNVMLGYWDRPEATAEALRGGWMHTGDAGWMDDAGYVYLTDRLKDMIISGGENVYSVEVESVLAQHPAVATAAVIGVPDLTWGERVHAVVVPVAGATVTLDELRAACAGRIAGYKAPRSMELVDALPLSAAGKVLKRELRRPYWEGHERAVH
ncbi:long-chain-fatty-acid--CoA ligase [Geodermatophilus sabuli]|uniref:Acyl-CoA synthetase (AMP-forming)/AMP-acid ligase II n=1 Tax=Geodermatophilus sabuli TaxID=1564158 RepID=A0A285EF20_9ACTN|nr:long-chain-fatty-acid--CoA ligase [Geodermatophilus sabuli]MBB3086639.1 acyl-CoA synthetase (AMP-forming)/AMP-acid ligase II [Geodermatophilus sabuli]SNX97709.1 Acyl-CoA synthetase (AMP-forming)/AMP-acid ligase II [Geodermatophilus sabuli]